MMIGQALRAGDVKLTGSMVLTEHPELVIAHVVGAKAEAAETAEAGATAEPEVIKKGKKEAEGEAEAKPKKK